MTEALPLEREQLTQGCYAAATRLGIEPATCGSRVWRSIQCHPVVSRLCLAYQLSLLPAGGYCFARRHAVGLYVRPQYGYVFRSRCPVANRLQLLHNSGTGSVVVQRTAGFIVTRHGRILSLLVFFISLSGNRYLCDGGTSRREILHDGTHYISVLDRYSPLLAAVSPGIPKIQNFAPLKRISRKR